MTEIMNKIKECLDRMRSSRITKSEVFEYSIYMNQFASYILQEKKDVVLSLEEIDALNNLLHICNIMYNRTDRNLLPIDNEVYDTLLERYKTYDSNFQVGSEDITFLNEPTLDRESNLNNVKTNVIRFYTAEEYERFKGDYDLYSDVLYKTDRRMNRKDVQNGVLNFFGDIDKRKHNTPHNHPDLVGTLDKCKFVLMNQAIEMGVEKDANVKVLERDFFAEHIKKGILDPNREITMILELKYDGVSVEGDCSNVVESARSRGDTGVGQGADITPILEGYPFPHSKMGGEEPLGIQFEAIMTHCDLMKFNMAKNYNYSNCRTAIIGLTGSGDASQYRDYITLVPIAVDKDQMQKICGTRINREEEIQFLNKCYATKGHPMQYVVIKGDYKKCLFLIKKFVEEAEVARNFLDFMYDGVVVEYMDFDLIDKLGRENYIDKYKMAIKFNPLRKQTTFRGYSYTVGQNGNITPMIHYDMVEFYGTIHTKSTGSSYERFQNLGLRVGDIINVEYTNDVMPYVTKPDCVQNLNNPNPLCEFITHCLDCGTPLVPSDSGKTMKCPNTNCGSRVIARVANMLQKLNLKDFGEKRVIDLGVSFLHEMIDLKYDDIEPILGTANAEKFVDRMNQLKIEPIYDYQIVGALGFDSIASKKWQLIFQHYTIAELYELWLNGGIESINHIKGIGKSIVDTIDSEMDYFEKDILYIMNMKNVISSKGMSSGKSIRCTGFRNGELMAQLRNMGYDADDNATVTKKTDILLVPYEGFTSTKTSKAGPDTLIVDVHSFMSDIDKYLN